MQRDSPQRACSQRPRWGCETLSLRRELKSGSCLQLPGRKVWVGVGSVLVSGIHTTGASARICERGCLLLPVFPTMRFEPSVEYSFKPSPHLELRLKMSSAKGRELGQLKPLF